MSLLLSACSSVRYYAQAVHGQGELIVHRRPIDKLLHDPHTDPELAARLRLALQARRFASRQLGLPDNRSYTGYVQLDRSYVVWNVFAAPRYSVQAVPQCFPIAGCVAYRGWFSEADAKADAARLHARGDDVWVGGVPAYSTLGWFADPILSSMLRWDDDELAGTIFHELAHQLIYVKSDTAFNESFATFVQAQGLRAWRASRGLPPQGDQRQALGDGFTHLVLDLRERLKTLYASRVDEVAMAAGKRREIDDFRKRYEHWHRRHWPDDHRYDPWVAQPINNARLLPFGLYDQWTPAFGVLFQRAQRSWPVFYAKVRKLAREPQAQRDDELQMLSRSAKDARL
ncbi:MAG: aminopeptidase [Rhodanobacter sp.]|nr:MAG: aminopeptidase [Rhodanobacter sp.]TAM06698.1 MAG: aminopeptidase [Rhodanobacter sp.]TAM41589.1 MAG: aminopeptidase [Rhodanobacter sp.]TAN28375.1 MAG: aminopeptidase [Rhodanobacter sp.]